MISKCRQDLCQDSALSFSEHCWNHVEQALYLTTLREAIDKAPRNTPLALNLKKVDGEGIDFSHLILKGSCLDQAKMRRCRFVGTDLSGAIMIGANFDRCDLVGADLVDTDLTRAVFAHSHLSFSDLRRSCLIEAVFRDTDLMGAVLWKANLWNTDISGAAHIKEKNFHDPTHPVDPKHACLSEGDAFTAFEAYRSVKHYFYQKGLIGDASWAGYRELTMERKHYYRTRDIRYIPSLLMDLLSGYTENPSRVIVSSLGLIILYGFLYYFLGAVRPVIDAHQAVGFLDHFYFSFITFTTVGFGDFVPTPLPWVRMLVCTEAFSGPFMAGLYIFTLTRRYAAS